MCNKKLFLKTNPSEIWEISVILGVWPKDLSFVWWSSRYIFKIYRDSHTPTPCWNDRCVCCVLKLHANRQVGVQVTNLTALLSDGVLAKHLKMWKPRLINAWVTAIETKCLDKSIRSLDYKQCCVLNQLIWEVCDLLLFKYDCRLRIHNHIIRM